LPVAFEKVIGVSAGTLLKAFEGGKLAVHVVIFAGIKFQFLGLGSGQELHSALGVGVPFIDGADHRD